MLTHKKTVIVLEPGEMLDIAVHHSGNVRASINWVDEGRIPERDSMEFDFVGPLSLLLDDTNDAGVEDTIGCSKGATVRVEDI